MDVIVFETEAYEKMYNAMMQKMYDTIRDAKEEALRNADPSRDWIDPKEAQALLGVKSKTKMQELRDMDELVYSKAGRTIKYSKRSIIDYIERHVAF